MKQNKNTGFWEFAWSKPVQNPPDGAFSQENLKWENEYDRCFAWIPYGRVDDFIKGEENNELNRTKFNKECKYQTWKEGDKCHTNHYVEKIVYWCQYGPKDESKVKKDAKRSKKEVFKRGCQCHFIVQRMRVDDRLAIILYKEKRHINKNGEYCHGRLDPTATDRFLHAPRISNELRHDIAALRDIGLSVHKIIVRYQLEKEKDPNDRTLRIMCSRDEYLKRKDVENIFKSKFGKDNQFDERDVSVQNLVQAHVEDVFLCRCPIGDELFSIGIQTLWMQKELSEYSAFNNSMYGVVNRDLSTAIIKAFVAKRKEEYKALVTGKCAQDAVPSKSNAKAEASFDNQKVNGKEDGVVNDRDINGVPMAAESGQPEKPNEHASLEEVVSNNVVTVDRLEVTNVDEVAQAEVLKTTEPSNVMDKTVTKRINKELPPVRILEVLGIPGLRSLRSSPEIEGIGPVIALDNVQVAIESFQRNAMSRGSTLAPKFKPRFADARIYMLAHEKQFDLVDLDPYGSPSILLDSAVQSVADGGVLMCAATDIAVFCGHHREACYSKYGAYPTNGKYFPEMALRILLACIESHANRYRRHIVPFLSLSVDFYIRVFVRVYTSANAMKSRPLKLSYVYQCIGCDSFHLQPLARTVNSDNAIRYAAAHGPVFPQECSDCGEKFVLGGPIWSDPIHDPDWISSTLPVVVSLMSCYPGYRKFHSVLTSISEELIDVPLYIDLDNICLTLKCSSPSIEVFKSAIINAGFRASGTHTNPVGIKTDAPMHVIWEIMRCWVKTHPVSKKLQDQPGCVIVSREPTLKVHFLRENVASGVKAKNLFNHGNDKATSVPRQNMADASAE